MSPHVPGRQSVTRIKRSWRSKNTGQPWEKNLGVFWYSSLSWAYSPYMSQPYQLPNRASGPWLSAVLWPSSRVWEREGSVSLGTPPKSPSPWWLHLRPAVTAVGVRSCRTGPALPHCGDRRILTMVAFGTQWPLMPEAPWQSTPISVYIESQTGNATGILCSSITHGIRLKWGWAWREQSSWLQDLHAKD